MKGHFSDPIAKVKTDCILYGSAPVPLSKKAKEEDVPFSNITPVNRQPTFILPAKSTGLAIAKTPTTSNSNTLSSKEKTAMPYHPADDYGHGRTNSNTATFGALLFIFLLLGVVCIVVAKSEIATSGGVAFAGCFPILLATICFIVALVFLILWIVALSRG